MWDRHPVSLSLVHMLPAVAEAHGLDWSPLLARAGIGGAFGTHRVVARAQVATLLEVTARRAGAATIGLRLASAADPARLGPSGAALFSGRTLRECLGAQARHMPSLQGGVRLALDERNGQAVWHHVLVDSDAEHAGVLNEGIAAFMARALRAISGQADMALRLGLPHRARASTSVYEDALTAGVSFGATGLSIRFDAAWLDQPNAMLGMSVPPAAGPEGLAELPDWRDDAALMAALRRILPGAALSGTLSLIDASRSLGLAPRSLQRRLSALGTSFEGEVDRWRRAEARSRLADPGQPIGAVARMLGYRDPAHFVRAFRRWEDEAPLSWRRALLARKGN